MVIDLDHAAIVQLFHRMIPKLLRIPGLGVRRVHLLELPEKPHQPFDILRRHRLGNHNKSIFLPMLKVRRGKHPQRKPLLNTAQLRLRYARAQAVFSRFSRNDLFGNCCLSCHSPTSAPVALYKKSRPFDQTPATRLLSLLRVLLILADDHGASCLTSSASETTSYPAATEERIGRVVSYLHTHYRDEINISKLMRTATLSRSSLHRSFKQQTNMTIGDYVAQLRIGNACALLMNSEKPISLIADEVGYSNLAHFNRQFKALKGKTPREFRAAFSR